MFSPEELDALRRRIVEAQTSRSRIEADVPGRIRWSYSIDNLEDCYSLIFTLEWFLTLAEPPQEHIEKALFRAERLIADTLSKLLSNTGPDLDSWQEVHMMGIWLYAWLSNRFRKSLFVEPLYQTAVHHIPQAHLYMIAERFPGIAEQGSRSMQQRWGH